MGSKSIASAAAAAAADDQRSLLPAAGNSESSNPNSSAVLIQQHSAIAKQKHNEHSRWPREEAMALLRIKSELTDQAKKMQDEADQDQILWEQISRSMMIHDELQLSVDRSPSPFTIEQLL
jgi:hypothetical protein